MRVGQVFAAFSTVGAADRLEAGLLLARPFELFPVSAADLLSQPLPVNSGVRRLFLQWIRAAVERAVDDDLTEWRLGKIIPTLAGIDGLVETSPLVTNRLIALVRGHGHRCWSDLADCTVGEIRRWNGAGSAMTALLITGAVDAAMRAMDAAAALQAGNGAMPELLDAEGSLFGGFGAVGPATDDGNPVRSPSAADLDAMLSGLTVPGQRIAFELDDLRLDDPYGMGLSRSKQTAELIGIGGERLRQIKHFARRQIRDSLADNEPLQAVIEELATLVGDLADRASLDDALHTVELPSTNDPSGLLALYLAGPYKAVPGRPGWWATQPGELLELTDRLLRESGGVHDRTALRDDFERAGLPQAVVDSWIVSQPVRVADDLVVHMAGRPADIAARVLEATGRAMSSDEIKSWMPGSDQASAVGAELRRSRVFVQTAPDLWELSEWGGEQSTQMVRWKIPVSASAIVGDEADAPSELVSLLALRPDHPVRLATRYGPIPLAYDGQRVVRGSARPVILAAGASVGDVLIIVIDLSGTATAVELDRGAATLW